MLRVVQPQRRVPHLRLLTRTNTKITQGTAVVRKAVVVAPATLVNNWAAEIKKWVGPERMRAMVLSSQVSQGTLVL